MIIDSICDLSQIDTAKIGTWSDLYYKFWSDFALYVRIMSVKCIVLVFDKQRFVPPAKAPTQKKRVEEQVLLEEMPELVGQLPENWRSFWGRRAWRIEVYRYLMRKLSQEPDLQLWGKKLFIDGASEDGMVYELIEGNGEKPALHRIVEHPDRKNEIGEADLCCPFWALQLSPGACRIVSVDTDYYLILLLYLHHYGQTADGEFLQRLYFSNRPNELVPLCELYRALLASIPPNIQMPLITFAWFMIMQGTDMVNPLPWLGPTFFTDFLTTASPDKIVEYSNFVGNIVLKQPGREGLMYSETSYINMLRFMYAEKYPALCNKEMTLEEIRTTLKSKYPKQPRAPPSDDELLANGRRAFWNLRYWIHGYTNFKLVPDPRSKVDGVSIYGWQEDEANDGHTVVSKEVFHPGRKRPRDGDDSTSEPPAKTVTVSTS